MKLNWLTKLILGKDVIELIYDYIQYKSEKSEGGRELTSTEKKHLLNIAFRIVENLISRVIKTERKKK